MPQASYEYAVGRISVLSTKMLDATQLRRISEAGSAQEALTLLLETGYGGNLNTDQINNQEIDYVIREQLQLSRKMVWELTPSPELTGLFLLEVDTHNIKTLLKSRLLGIDAPDVLVEGGIFPVDLLRECINNKNYEELPETYRNAMDKSKQSYKERLIHFCLVLKLMEQCSSILKLFWINIKSMVLFENIFP